MPKLKIAIAILSISMLFSAIPAKALSPLETLKRWDATEEERERALSALNTPSSPAKVVQYARELMKSENWRARMDALQLSINICLPEMLEKGLTDKNWAVRARAAELATYISDRDQRDKIRPILREACKDKIHSVRKYAYATLIAWGNDPKLLAEAIEDPSAEIVTWAAARLVQAAGGQGGITNELKARLVEKTVDSWSKSGWAMLDNNALQSFFSLGPASIEELFAALSQEPPQIRSQVLGNIWNMGCGNVAIPLYARFMDDPDTNVSQLAVRAVAENATVAAAPAILKRLETTTDHFQRSMLINAITRLNYKPAAPFMLKMMKTDQQFRHMALNALIQLGDKSMLPEVLDMYKREPQPYLRGMMLPLIARWMDKGADAFLKEAFLNGDLSCRGGAIRGALYLPAEQKKNFLLFAIKEDNSEYIRAQTLQYMGEFKTDDVVDVVLEVLKGEQNENVVGTGLRALAMMGTEKSIRAIIEYAENAEDAQKPNILQSLHSMQTPEAGVILRKYLNTKDAEVRNMIFNVIASRFPELIDEKQLLEIMSGDVNDDMLFFGSQIMMQRNIRSPKFIPFLEKMLASEQQHVKVNAISCLSMLKNEDPKAIKLLIDMIKDNDEPVRQVAIHNLVNGEMVADEREKEIVKALSEALDGADESTMMAIVSNISGCGNSGFRPVLMKALTLNNPPVAETAAQALMQNLEGEEQKAMAAELKAIAEKMENEDVKQTILNVIENYETEDPDDVEDVEEGEDGEDGEGVEEGEEGEVEEGVIDPDEGVIEPDGEGEAEPGEAPPGEAINPELHPIPMPMPAPMPRREIMPPARAIRPIPPPAAQPPGEGL